MKFGIRGQLIDVITCQFFSQSVQELWSSDTPKLPFPIDLLRRPYNSVRTAVRHCDNTLPTGKTYEPVWCLVTAKLLQNKHFLYGTC